MIMMYEAKDGCIYASTTNNFGNFDCFCEDGRGYNVDSWDVDAYIDQNPYENKLKLKKKLVAIYLAQKMSIR